MELCYRLMFPLMDDKLYDMQNIFSRIETIKSMFKSSTNAFNINIQ